MSNEVLHEVDLQYVLELIDEIKEKLARGETNDPSNAAEDDDH